MFSRDLPALLCFAVLLVSGRAADFPWAGHGLISFEIPTGWKIEKQSAGESFTLVARPSSEVAALLQITLIDTPPTKPTLTGNLTDRLQDSLAPYIEQSVEKEFLPIRLRSRQGKGWYAELTDAALVGKPPVAGDYKVMRSAIVALDPQLVAVATMQFDNPAADEAGEMLAFVSSMRFARKSAGK